MRHLQLQRRNTVAAFSTFTPDQLPGVTDGEKSKTGKKGAKAPWAKPLSRYSQDYLKITEEQLKASSPGKSQTDDQIQTQEPAVQSQPEVTSRETMAASPPRQD
ncbi:hypothetical protein Bca101_071773 [Brassica carinata]